MYGQSSYIPLNALANDQLYFRLAPLLLRQLKDPGVTFGRFTGQVRANTGQTHGGGAPSRQRCSEGGSGACTIDYPPPQFLASLTRLDAREASAYSHHQLRDAGAPTALATQRPALSKCPLTFPRLGRDPYLFAGAQAIEVAFLLRKLKVQLGLETGSLQVVGTSASLNVKDSRELAQFASDLFGEEFDASTDLISGDRETHPELRTRIRAYIPQREEMDGSWRNRVSNASRGKPHRGGLEHLLRYLRDRRRAPTSNMADDQKSSNSSISDDVRGSRRRP